MKTFLPTLFEVVYVLCTYITRHGDKLRENLTSDEHKALFDALHDACTAFLLIRSVYIIPGD